MATFFSEEEWIELLSSYPDFYDLVAEALGADDPIGLVGADLDDSEEWEPLRAARERIRRRIVMQNRTDGTLH